MAIIRLFFLIFTCSLSGILWSQSLQFRDFIIAASSPTNPKEQDEGFLGSGGKDRFELTQWGKGWAMSNGGEVIDVGYSFNFDYSSNDLYVKKDGEAGFIINEKNTLKKFMLFNGADSLFFVKCFEVDNTHSKMFQLLGGNPKGKIAFLKMRISKPIAPNKNDYVRNFNGDYSIEYKNTTVYYLVDKNGAVKIFNKLSRIDLLSIYPEHQQLIKEYLPKKNKPNEKTIGLIIAAINAL